MKRSLSFCASALLVAAIFTAPVPANAGDTQMPGDEPPPCTAGAVCPEGGSESADGDEGLASWLLSLIGF